MSADALDDNLDLNFRIEPDIESENEAIDISAEPEANLIKDGKNPLEEIMETHSSLSFHGPIQLSSLSSLKKKNVLIISSSAIKCTRILSRLKFLKRRIGKLFAKHLKIKDQIESLQNSKTNLNVGTPNRLLKLGQFLKLEKLDIIIIDMEKDLKQFSILDIKDTRKDLISLLGSIDSLALDSKAIKVYELQQEK